MASSDSCDKTNPNGIGHTRRALSRAERDDKESVVRVLISAGIDVNKASKIGKTIFFAVHSRNEKMVSLLINAGVDVNVTDNEGKTALFYAVQNGNESMVDLFITCGVDVNAIDNEGKTALFYAVQNDNENVVDLLITCGVDVNVADNEGETALYYAVQNGNESMVDSLITNGADVNIISKKGKTILSYAAQSGNEKTVSLLIDAGADVNVIDKNGETALFYAVRNSNESVVDLLITNGADVNIKAPKHFDRTALSYAVSINNEYIVNKLIEAGADVNAIYGFHDNALIMAVSKHNNNIVSRLIDAGGDVNIIDGNGTTPAWIAAIRGDSIIVSKLLHAGADVNTPDTPKSFDLSAFSCALTTWAFRFNRTSMSEEEYLKFIQMFVEDGHADVNKRDIRGRNSLFYSKSASVTSYLIKKGANLFLRDKRNVSVLSSYLQRCISAMSADDTIGKDSSLSCNMVQILLQHGLEKEAVFEAIINLLFASALSLYTYNGRNIQGFYKMLEWAKDFIPDTGNENRPRERIENLIDNMISMIKNEVRDATSYYESIVPRILASLTDLGANPNSVDSSGNTALHYATCLGEYRFGIPHLSQETVRNICHQLINFGALLQIKNVQEETPLLFCLSSQLSHSGSFQMEVSQCQILVEVCKFLLEHGASVEDATQGGLTVFHYILELFDQIFRYKSIEKTEPHKYIAKLEPYLQELIKLCQLFFNPKVRGNKEFTVNKRSANGLLSPLHKWASLELKYSLECSAADYTKKLVEDNTFEKVLKLILMGLLEFGAKLNDRDEDEQTPLHLCATWTAVNLLLDVEAKPNVVDSSGRLPLLSAANRAYSTNLYPDVTQEPKAFWRTALEKGLDPWAVDNHGESVLSVLIGSQRYGLSKALVEVACDDEYIQLDTVASTILNAICNDKSTRTHWKSNLVKIILTSTRNPISGSLSGSALHLCCRNVIVPDPDDGVYLHFFDVDDIDEIDEMDNIDDDGVHWTIAKLLLAYGADVNVRDTNGQSCLDIAEDCLPLKELLLSPQNVDEIPLLIPWTSVSRTHEAKLAQVARRQESKHVESFWYHQDLVQSGTFGAVYAGINEKDGREVAIKRMEKRHMQRPEDKREITNLAVLADCQQVVRYLCFFEDEHFSYVVLELMEGNLEECLDKSLRIETREQLCRDVVDGLQFLHALNILHRDLKPTNILYRTHPKLCLKIADFGLSRRTDSSSTTVYGTNVGTRCWISPEVLNSAKDHSKSSDVFSCGLVLHYILSEKKHPFAPADCAKKSVLQISLETELNLISDKIEGWDNSLCAEATHLVRKMLDSDERRRLNAEEAPSHPLFWPKRKKINLLVAVGNQNPEFACPRAKRRPPLSAVEIDLETAYGPILRVPKWDDPRNVNMPVLYSEMTRKRSPYDTISVVELVRFVRNAYAHVTELSRSDLLLKDYVFLEYFPNLVMEVYKAVTTHGWDQTREEIKDILKN